MKIHQIFLKASVCLALLSQISPCYSGFEDDEASQGSLRMCPPSPWQMSNYSADYQSAKETGKISGDLTLSQYLGLTHKVRQHVGGKEITSSGEAAEASSSAPRRVSVPTRPLTGNLNVKVLLIDFEDRVGTQPTKYYERMLFSEGKLRPGSMRDYYLEVSQGKLKVTGTVDGWIRMPQRYSYYTNEESGMGGRSYPRNAQRMAEDAVRAALQMGVVFNPELDALKNGTVTALFLIHAGRGAETLPPREGRQNIWSHKWNLRTPVQVGEGARRLLATTYLTVPNDCMVGVCAHELGHLAMGWDDFYDPNYDEDGAYWDGAGNWDLMAGGSYGEGGMRPVHPIGLHKAQHNWVKKETIDVSALAASRSITLYPFTHSNYSVLELRSSAFGSTQSLLLECRQRHGFDRSLPGEGLLVWRVDPRQEMTSPNSPALLLVQADGKHNLENGRDGNGGDEGDPFPGSSRTTQLLDTGDISTSFPGRRSGIFITNITRNPVTGEVSFKVKNKKQRRAPKRSAAEISHEEDDSQSE